MPSATELPKKISENDSPTTARMPLRRIACGACSRDEPQPKFAFTSRIVAPAIGRIGHRMRPTRPLRAACDRPRTGAAASPSNVIACRKRAGMMRSVSMLSPRSGSAVPGDLANPSQSPCSGSSRTSTTSPATAAAATIAGLISSVRPVGLPCRPLKLRFDEEAQISRPSSLSGIHRQAHRAAGAAPVEPRVDEHAIEPFALRGGAHRLRARHDQRPHVRRDVPAADDPSRPRARSDSRAFVHEPTNATSIFVPWMRVPGCEPHELERFADRRAIGSGDVAGSAATRPRTPTARD